MNENRLYKLLKTLMDPQTDLKTLLKTYVGLANSLRFSRSDQSLFHETARSTAAH